MRHPLSAGPSLYPNDAFVQPTLPALPLQASGEGMDSGAPAWDMPPLLRPRGDAHLFRQHGRTVQLEQE